MRARLAALVGLSMLAPEASASERFALSWSAPDSCPSASEVEGEIERALARVDSAPPVKVVAQVTSNSAAGAGFALHVVVLHDGESSERTLTVSECAEVARATALFVALAVQSEPGEPAPEAPAPPVTAQEPAVPPSPEPAPPRDEAPVVRASTFGISLGPQAAIGFGPSTDLGVDIGVGLGIAARRDFLRVLVRGSSFLTTESTVGGTSLGGDFSLFSAAAFGCVGPTISDVALWPCVGGKLYHLRGEGFGTDADETRSTTIFAAVAALELEWRLPRGVFVLAGVEGGYAPDSARFVIDNIGLVHETGHVFGESRVEVGASF